MTAREPCPDAARMSYRSLSAGSGALRLRHSEQSRQRSIGTVTGAHGPGRQQSGCRKPLPHTAASYIERIAAFLVVRHRFNEICRGWILVVTAGHQTCCPCQRLEVAPWTDYNTRPDVRCLQGAPRQCELCTLRRYRWSMYKWHATAFIEEDDE